MAAAVVGKFQESDREGKLPIQSRGRKSCNKESNEEVGQDGAFAVWPHKPV